MAGPGNILIKIGADAGQAVSELGRVNSSLGDTMSASQKMGAGLQKAAVPAAIALGAIGIAAAGAAKAAAEDAAEQEHLAGVLERTTGATSDQVAATEAWIGKISLATGVADSEMRPALEKIVTATKDVGKAQTLMGQAMDISAASGKDLDTVSAAIAKGYTGQTAALEKLIPGLSESAKASNDFKVIMDELAVTTGGAAAESAGTAAGQYKVLSNQMGELQEQLGAALLPAIQALVPVLQKMATFAGENTDAITILVGAVTAVAGAIVIANAAIKLWTIAQAAAKAATVVWTAAQWLLNAALEANPIGIVIIALTALGVGLVLAYKKSETFRDIVHGAMDIVKASVQALATAFTAVVDAATTAFNWVVAHWKLGLFAFGPLGAAIYVIVTNFDSIKGAAQAAWDFIKSAWQVGKFAFGPIEAAIGAVADAFGSIVGAVQSAINAVESLISALGRIHVPSIHLPNLPGPFLAPVPSAAVGPTSRGAAGTTAVGAGGVTVNVYGAVDPEGTARAIKRILDRHDRRQGKVFE